MLHLYIGNRDDTLIAVSDYFDATFEDSWIDNELSKEMILDVDKSKVIYSHVIESPILGPITPRELSGGVKSLILMAFDTDMNGKYFFGGQLGDNTLPWVLKIADKKDIYIEVTHYLGFNKGFKDKVYIDNTSEIVEGYNGYLETYRKLRVV
jgi:hypothetical protein